MELGLGKRDLGILPAQLSLGEPENGAEEAKFHENGAGEC